MDAGDGASGEDHARSYRLTSADEDVQRGRQAVVHSARQVVGRPFADEFPVDVEVELDRRTIRSVGQDRTEHQTVVVPEVGGDDRRAERVDVRDRAAGHLDADQQLLLQVRGLRGGPTALVVGGQILTEPNDQFGLHGREPGLEDPDLDGGFVLLAELELPRPDRSDQSIRIPGLTPVRRDEADLPADQRVRPLRYRLVLDSVGLGHAGRHHTRESRQTPARFSGGDQLGGDRSSVVGVLIWTSPVCHT